MTGKMKRIKVERLAYIISFKKNVYIITTVKWYEIVLF